MDAEGEQVESCTVFSPDGVGQKFKLSSATTIASLLTDVEDALVSNSAAADGSSGGGGSTLNELNSALQDLRQLKGKGAANPVSLERALLESHIPISGPPTEAVLAPGRKDRSLRGLWLRSVL